MDTSAWGVEAEHLRQIQQRAEGKSIMLRTRTVDASQHAGRAKLVSVVNDHSAEIQPLGNHEVLETVPLSTLKIHKSECIRSGIDISFVKPFEIKLELKPPPEMFVVFSESMGGVWSGGTHSWVKYPHQASRYTTLDLADAAANKFKDIPSGLCRDATGVTMEEVYDLLGKVHQEMAKTQLVKAHETPKSTSLGVSMDDLIKKIIQKQAQKAGSVDLVAQAQREYDKAKAEYDKAEAALDTAKKQLDAVKAIGKVKLTKDEKQMLKLYEKLNSGTANTKKEVGFKSHRPLSQVEKALLENPNGKRIPYLKNAIMYVLRSGGKLNRGQIKSAVDALVKDIDHPKIPNKFSNNSFSPALAKMEAENVIVSDVNGNYWSK